MASPQNTGEGGEVTNLAPDLVAENHDNYVLFTLNKISAHALMTASVQGHEFCYGGPVGAASAVAITIDNPGSWVGTSAVLRDLLPSNCNPSGNMPVVRPFKVILHPDSAIWMDILIVNM